MDDVTKRLIEDKENPLREFLFILFERKKIVLSIFLPVSIVCLILALALPPTYRASAKFSLLVRQALDPLQQERTYDYKNIARRYLQEQKEIILSYRVLERVAEKSFPGARPEEIPKLVDKVRENLDVTPPGGESFEETSVYYLSYKGSDPHQVAAIAKNAADAYLEVFDEISKAKSEYSVEFFKEQSSKLYADMVEKERQLREYETEQAASLFEILNLGSNQVSVELAPSALLTSFMRKYHELQEEFAGLNAAIEEMEEESKQSGIPVVPTEMDQTGRTVSLYKNKVAQLQILMNEMKSQFTTQFGPLKQTKDELQLTVDSMKEELGRSIRAQKMNAQTIAARLQELERIIAALQERIRTTAKERSVYEHKRQAYQLAKDAYVYVTNQMEQARLANALHNSKQNLTLVDAPVVPLKPFKPDRGMIAALGFIAGLCIGIAAAVTVDYLDHTIKRPRDIERYLDVPILGSVPKVG